MTEGKKDAKKSLAEKLVEGRKQSGTGKDARSDLEALVRKRQQEQWDPEASEEVTRETKEWLSRKWPKSECPVCGETNWAVGELVQTPLVHKAGRIYKFVPVSCVNCGNTQFFNPEFFDSEKDSEK